MEVSSTQYYPLKYFVGQFLLVKNKNSIMILDEDYEKIQKTATEQYMQYYSSMTHEQYEIIKQNAQANIIKCYSDLAEYKKHPNPDPVVAQYNIQYYERQCINSQKLLQEIISIEHIIGKSIAQA